jgi:hypothetical protein
MVLALRRIIRRLLQPKTVQYQHSTTIWKIFHAHIEQIWQRKKREGAWKLGRQVEQDDCINLGDLSMTSLVPSQRDHDAHYIVESPRHGAAVSWSYLEWVQTRLPQNNQANIAYYDLKQAV